MWIDENGNRWYKGNLHTHTTASDGAKTPSEVAELYRSHDYDFLALTDHWVVSENAQKDGLLLLSGCEYNFGTNVRDGIFHIVGLGMERDPGVQRDDTPQTCIDKIHAVGGLAQLAHPAWSMNTLAQITSLRDLDATEIYNSVSGLPRNCRPYSGEIVDILAAHGVFLPLLATDDAHFYYEADTCRSYIWVQAGECTREAILSAIRQGKFYATQGPRLSVTQEGRTLRVRSTPVVSLVCYTDYVWETRRSVLGDGVTEAEFPVGAEATCARIEATDAQGRTAWSAFFRMS